MTDNKTIERQWNAGELLKVSGSFWESCTLHSAVELDVFTAISSTPTTCEEVAEKLNIPVDGLNRLLNALTAMQLLIKKEKSFTTTPESEMFLSKHSEKYIGFLIRHHYNLSHTWSRLAEAVSKGEPFRRNVEEMPPNYIESFLMGMHTISSFTAPTLMHAIDLSDCNHLLDLGGGPGTYAIQFCNANPNLKGTVFDLPTSRSFAEKNIANFGLSNRIDFIDGNFNTDEITGKYDAIWMSHILHSEGDDGCSKLIEKAAARLNPNGKIIIHEFILDNNATGPLFPALFTLNMFLHTDKGKSYTEEELSNMLTNAGLKNIQRPTVKTPMNSGIIIGSK